MDDGTRWVQDSRGCARKVRRMIEMNMKAPKRRLEQLEGMLVKSRDIVTLWTVDRTGRAVRERME